MEMLGSFLLQTITSTAFSLVFLAGIGCFFRTWIGNRIHLSVKNEYDNKLERLKAELKTEGDAHLTDMKAELDRQSNILKIAAASFSEVQKATISRKIDAVDVLWKGIIDFRKKIPGVVSFTDVLIDEEMKNFYTDPRLYKYSHELEQFDMTCLINASSEEVKLVRPHIGEFVWALYSTYCTILMRSIYLLKAGKNEPFKVAWHCDANIEKLILVAFGEECSSEFKKLRWGRYQWLHNQFDSSLFKAIDTLLTGKKFSDAALHEAQLMERQISASRSNELKISHPL